MQVSWSKSGKIFRRSSGSKPLIVEAGELISLGWKPFVVEAGELIRYNIQSTLREFWVEAMIPLLMWPNLLNHFALLTATYDVIMTFQNQLELWLCIRYIQQPDARRTWSLSAEIENLNLRIIYQARAHRLLIYSKPCQQNIYFCSKLLLKYIFYYM